MIHIFNKFIVLLSINNSTHTLKLQAVTCFKMACNSCAKPYTLFRKENGCPGCGFSYCSKCLVHKIFLKKINREAKVCSKCKRLAGVEPQEATEPPDTYYKRIGDPGPGIVSNTNNKHNVKIHDTDEEIKKRLQNLKEDKKDCKISSNEEIQKRLKGLKGDQPSISDADLQLRLANLKGEHAIDVQNKPVLCAPDFRTEQEQANDLMKQYLEQANIDTQYKEGFDKQINDIEARIQKLKGAETSTDSKSSTAQADAVDFADEETTLKKIIEKAKAEALLQDEDIAPPTDDELPFCEICNEDASMRCLGCRYLFCRLCFNEHKDDDDGCDRYEPYKPPKNL